MKKILVLSVFISMFIAMSAEINNIEDYRRSSIYVAVLSSGTKFYKDEVDKIVKSAKEFKLSDKYNDHRVGSSLFELLKSEALPANFNPPYRNQYIERPKVYKKYNNSSSIISYGPLNLRGAASEVVGEAIYGEKYNLNETIRRIDGTLRDKKVAQQMIYKWFNGKKTPRNGLYYDVDLIKERGAYNANELDILMANESVRGMSIVQDAGLELIPNTYFLGLDILLESNADQEIREFNDRVGFYKFYEHTSEYVKNTSEHLAGYSVTIVGYLFKLTWNEETENLFFSKYYNEHPDKLFESDEFKLEFVGNSIVEKRYGFWILGKGHANDPVAYNDIDPVFRKKKSLEALSIAIPQCIEKTMATLQDKYEDFRVKAPIIDINKNGVTSFIGYKEGLNKNSKFEVLQKKYNEKKNRFEYEKVGNLKVDSKNIWDNRYTIQGAPENVLDEIKNINYSIDRSFLKGKTKNLAPGMLIRQTK